VRTIWKFDLEESLRYSTNVDGVPVFDLEFPTGSVTLDVQMQHGRPVFWVDLYDQNQPNVNRFAVVGTGQRIPTFVRDWEGTWQDDGLVWHLYSVDEELYQLALRNAAEKGSGS
jgi:hypothetical protein